MGMFDTEENISDIFIQEDAKRANRYKSELNKPTNEQNIWRMAGYALDKYNERKNPRVKLEKDRQEIMAGVKFDDLGSLQSARQKARESGDTDLQIELLRYEQAIPKVVEKETFKPFTKKVVIGGKKYIKTGQTNQLNGKESNTKFHQVDADKAIWNIINEDGTFNSQSYSTEPPKTSNGQYVTTADPKAPEGNGTWKETSILAKGDQEETGVLYNGKRNLYNIDGKELTPNEAFDLGYAIPVKSNDQNITFLNTTWYDPESKEYHNGSWDSSSDKGFYTDELGVRREIPKGFVRRSFKDSGEGGDKDLNRVTGQKLVEKGMAIDAYSLLVEGFKDDYAGYPLDFIGDIANFAQKKGFGNESEASWWQGYDTMTQAIRHSNFGSALTPTELNAFKKLIVNKSHSSDFVKKQMALQLTVLTDAAKRMVNLELAKGISGNQLKAAVGDMAWNLAYPPKQKEKDNVKDSISIGDDGIPNITLGAR